MHTFDDAVRYARQHLDDDRNVVHLTQSYLAGGWWPPDPDAQNSLRERAIAAVAEARRAGPLQPTKRTTGRTMFL